MQPKAKDKIKYSVKTKTKKKKAAVNTTAIINPLPYKKVSH